MLSFMYMCTVYSYGYSFSECELNVRELHRASIVWCRANLCNNAAHTVFVEAHVAV